jgi:hypothetical protein
MKADICGYGLYQMKVRTTTVKPNVNHPQTSGKYMHVIPPKITIDIKGITAHRISLANSRKNLTT